MSTSTIHHLTLDSNQVDRVINAILAVDDRTGTLKDHEHNTQLIAEIKRQQNLCTVEKQAEAMNGILAKDKPELYVTPSGRLHKRMLELRDTQDCEVICTFPPGTTLETMLHVRGVLKNTHQDGVKAGERQFASKMRDLIGASADPHHPLNEDM